MPKDKNPAYNYRWGAVRKGIIAKNAKEDEDTKTDYLKGLVDEDEARRERKRNRTSK